MNVMLDGWNTQFHIIGLSETWVTESNYYLYNTKMYAVYHKILKHNDRGGIALYINNGIGYAERSDLEIDSRIAETTFIEINHSPYYTKNIVIGLFDKAPNQDIDLSNNVFSDFTKKVNKKTKIIYLLGDYNTDLLKTVICPHQIWLKCCMQTVVSLCHKTNQNN